MQPGDGARAGHRGEARELRADEVVGVNIEHSIAMQEVNAGAIPGSVVGERARGLVVMLHVTGTAVPRGERARNRPRPTCRSG